MGINWTIGFFNLNDDFLMENSRLSCGGKSENWVLSNIYRDRILWVYSTTARGQVLSYLNLPFFDL